MSVSVVTKLGASDELVLFNVNEVAKPLMALPILKAPVPDTLIVVKPVSVNAVM